MTKAVHEANRRLEFCDEEGVLQRDKSEGVLAPLF